MSTISGAAIERSALLERDFPTLIREDERLDDFVARGRFDLDMMKLL
jgi:hypothetical protein